MNKEEILAKSRKETSFRTRWSALSASRGSPSA